MLMTGDEILEAYHKGEIVIDPFCPDNANSASYDVSLGPFYYRQREPKQRPLPLADTRPSNQADWKVDPTYDPYAQIHIDGTWKLCRAQKYQGDDNLVIYLKPKEIILAHTLEFIGSVPRPEGTSITTQMHSRSSSVRNCIDVCGSGGFGDSGFFSRWTMEVVNHSPHYAALLVVGYRIAQISFWRTATTQHNYAKEGKYQQSDVLAEVKASWTPSMLLPKTYQDREVGKPNPHHSLIQKLIHKYPIER